MKNGRDSRNNRVYLTLAKALLLLSVVVMAASSQAATRYIKVGGSDTGSCASVAGACASFGYVFGQSGSNDVILVAGGSYAISAQIIQTVAVSIFGGYNADFSSRDVVANESIFAAANTSVPRFFAPNTGHTNWNLYDGVTFSGFNYTGASGGTLHTHTGGALIRMNRVTFKNNTQSTGGAIEMNVQGDQLVITNSTFTNNTAEGGANVAQGVGWHSQGGAIAMGSGTQLTISGSTFSGNSATEVNNSPYNGSGGAIAISGGNSSANKTKVSISDTLFTGNSAYSLGGAIYLEGDYPNGGRTNRGNYLDVAMEGNTFTLNSARYGGAMQSWFMDANANINVVNNTFYSNNATTGYGGAIGCANGSHMTISHSTLYNNSTGGTGGGIYTRDTTSVCTIKNSILVGNTDSATGGNIHTVDAVSIVASEYNIIGSSSSSGWSGGTVSGNSFTSSQTNAQILASALAANGGATQTLALVGGSHAINAIPNCKLGSDQRGESRLAGAVCDIGAYEDSPSFDSDGVRGPGGVGGTSGGSALELWMKGDVGLSGTQWLDQSGNGNTFSAASGGVVGGSISSGSLNGYATASITGNQQYIDSAATFNLRSVFLVYQDNGDQAYATPIGSSGSGFLHGHADGTQIMSDSFGNDKTRDGNSYANGQEMANNVTYDRPDSYEIHSHVLTNNLNTGGAWYLGSDQCCFDRSINGGIAEVVMLANKNTAQRIIIENYLAAKYGLALGDNDKYTGDNSGYDHEMAGIGRALDGDKHLHAQGSGRVYISNASDMDYDEFLMWGHNNGTLALTNTDKPAALRNRLHRVWSFNKGELGTVDISFDGAGITDINELVLLIDSDSTFATGAVEYPGTYNASTKVTTFTAVDLPASGYFTFSLTNNDTDGDGVNNDSDNCPGVANAGQTDTDSDGEGDACDADDDGDGILDSTDVNDLIHIGTCADLDNDGAPDDACDGGYGGMAADPDDDGDLHNDGSDNCPINYNPDQLADVDNDGIGDACDPDADNDGVFNGVDNCPLVANASGQSDDMDSDGIGDACDPDNDNDGVLNGADNCPFIANVQSENVDGDSFGDACDTDIDGDGVLNATDNCDYDVNPSQFNIDGDSLGDVCDPDIDNDGVLNGDDNCPSIVNPSQQMICSIAYVEEGGAGDCSSWAQACGDLRAAVIGGEQQVWAKSGSYTVSQTIDIPDGVYVYGGFAGNEASIWDRDIASNLTTITASGVGRVFSANGHGLTNYVLVEGFTISGANGTADGGVFYANNVKAALNNNKFIGNDGQDGAVVYAVGGTQLYLNNNTFEGNTASGEAGAVSISGGLLEASGNIFKSNVAQAGSGGAIIADNLSRLWIFNSEFELNSAGSNSGNTPLVFGGALYISGAQTSIIVQDSQFVDNVVLGAGSPGWESSGGAIGFAASYSSSSTVSVKGVYFEGNQAAYTGGAVSMIDGAVDVAFNTVLFDSNQAPYGGGLQAYKTSHTIAMNNVTFVQNKALTAWGGGANILGAATLLHTTFVGNTAGTQGGGLRLQGGSLLLDNSLLVGNTDASGGANIYINSGAVNALSDYNLVGNSTGEQFGFDFDGVNNNVVSQLVADQIVHLTAQGYGGQFKAVPLMPNSIARNIIPTGTAGCNVDSYGLPAGYDMRGYSRPDRLVSPLAESQIDPLDPDDVSECDVGAFEFNNSYLYDCFIEDGLADYSGNLFQICASEVGDAEPVDLAGNIVGQIQDINISGYISIYMMSLLVLIPFYRRRYS